jgi:hypothetical protein
MFLDATFLTNLDQTLFHYINSFCGHSLALDYIANRLESSASGTPLRGPEAGGRLRRCRNALQVRQTSAATVVAGAWLAPSKTQETQNRLAYSDSTYSKVCATTIASSQFWSVRMKAVPPAGI